MKRRVAGIALVSLTLFLTSGKAWSQASGQSDKQKVFLGVAIEPSATDAKHAGVVVRSVAPDSPAAKSGLKEGDIINKVAGAEVNDVDSLIGALRKHRPGEQVTFHVVRDDQEKNLHVTLGQLPARRPGEEGPFAERGGAFLGVQTQALTPQIKEKLNLSTDHGVVIADVLRDTPAAKAGLKRDDVIVSFASKPITNPKELRDAVHAAGVGQDAPVSVLRSQEKKEIHVRLEELPVDGLSFGPGSLPAPFEGRLAPSIIQNLERLPQLERRIQELEKRIRDLEQNRTAPPK